MKRGNFVQIDLRSGRLLHQRGYDRHIGVECGVVVDGYSLVEQNRHCFFRGVLPDSSSHERVLKWLHRFEQTSVGDWARTFDGDFNLIVWDVELREITIISDRIGAHRLYVHCSDGVATITDSLLDQARLQHSPRLSEDGIAALLTVGFCADPGTLLRDTFALTIGTFATCTAKGTNLVTYYQPVNLVPSNFETLEECLTQFESGLTATIESQLVPRTTPIVMVSGGIDSLVLLRYVTATLGPSTRSITFAVEGQRQNELEEGRIAAQYYGSRHTEYVIPLSAIDSLVKRSLAESDIAGYGGVESTALSDWFAGSETDLSVFRGEDTRLHTPALDLPARIGLLAHRSGLQNRPASRYLWQPDRIAELWPLRRGRNYLEHVAAETRLRSDLRSFVLEVLAHWHVLCPDGSEPLPSALARGIQDFPDQASVETILRWAVRLNYGLQYTDNMDDARSACETARSVVLLPFYHPTMVDIANRVPARLGTKTMLVGRRQTRSPFPVSDKYVLRKLLAGAAPPELLYRRKATAPAMDVYFRLAGKKTVFPVLQTWLPGVVETLDGYVGHVVDDYRSRVLASADACGGDLQLGSMALTLARLAVLHRVIEDRSVDLADELEVLWT